MAALTIDGGRIMEERRNDQVIADAAALAGASDLYMNYSTAKGTDLNGTAKAVAIQIANANGISTGALTVNIPPLTGPFAGQPGYIEVVIRTEVDGSFSKSFTSSNVVVSARSVARGLPMKIGMILLRPSGPDAFVNNGLAFAIVNSPLRVNSSDSAAYRQASVGAVVASQIDLTGDYVNPGGAIMLGKIRKKVPPTPDPLAYLPVPDPELLPLRESNQLVIDSNVPTSLLPGVYQGGIRIRHFSIVTMQPGVYIMQGGGFQVEDDATVVGSETMVYNSNDAAHAAGPISVTTKGKVLMTAPMSGSYQGVSLFQHRGQANPISISGNGLLTIAGLVYAPKAQANLATKATVGVDLVGGAYVVESATVNGLGSINIKIGQNQPRIPDIRLVE
jgi:hypothetical protein